MARDHHGMTEAEAMDLCRDSPYVTRLVEEFHEDGKTNIVTKYEQGSDLVNMIKQRGSKKFGEKEARSLFRQMALGL